jgi:hypothetical protein
MVVRATLPPPSVTTCKPGHGTDKRSSLSSGRASGDSLAPPHRFARSGGHSSHWKIDLRSHRSHAVSGSWHEALKSNVHPGTGSGFTGHHMSAIRETKCRKSRTYCQERPRGLAYFRRHPVQPGTTDMGITNRTRHPVHRRCGTTAIRQRAITRTWQVVRADGGQCPNPPGRPQR